MAERPLRLLLVEDNPVDKETFLTFCDTENDIQIVGTASGCSDGIPMVDALHPDVVILDLELADGTGLHFLFELEKLPPNQRPHVVVTTVVHSPVTLAMARRHGSNFEFIKTNFGYDPELVVTYLRQARPFMHTVSPPGAYLQKAPVFQPENNMLETWLRELIQFDLHHLGITPDLKGYRPIEEALVILARDEQRKIQTLVPVNEKLHRLLHKPTGTLTRNMRTAIERAWNVTTLDDKQRLYPGAINPKRGNPTVKEFLFTMAEKYRTSMGQTAWMGNELRKETGNAKSEDE